MKTMEDTESIISEIPWTEKYRPTELKHIVLEPYNRNILKNIINNKDFPNLLFYGPPGTGKTTTIINLIREYNKRYNYKGKELVMHLNASDERGIDIIRNQIQIFVNTNTLFGNGLKYVILDEVDYMTKTAQIELKHLLNNYKNVRYCLICNYISKIDKSLQENFIHFRFNQLPSEEIQHFIIDISNKEKLKLSKKHILSIMDYFKSDIRSMINYIQANFISLSKIRLIDNSVFDALYGRIENKNIISIDVFYREFNKIACRYNIGIQECIKKFCYYINNKINFLNETQYIIHNLNIDKYVLLNYLLSSVKVSLNNSCSNE